jgi:hypothetical protein
MQLMLAQPKIDVDSQVVPTATFDPPVVKPFEPATYRVTLNALETAIEWPDKIPAPPNLDCRPGAHGQILSMTGPLLVPRTTFNYRVRASEAGRFTIPEFTIKVNGKLVTVPAAQLQSTATPPPGIPPTQLVFLDLLANSLFVGQSIRARVLLPGSLGGMVQSLGQVQINGHGFITDQTSAHARIEAMPLGPGGKNVNTFVYELMLTPIAVGKLSVTAQGYAVGNRVIGGIILPGPGTVNGALPQYNLVDSDPITLEVRPLPPGNTLAGFTGAVGTFSVDPPELSTNRIPVGEPLKLRVKFRGDGNLSRLVPPSPPRVRDWQVFPAVAENAAPQIIQAQGSIAFEYVLIPLNEKTRATPPISFCTFSPDHAAYDDLTIPPVALTVLPGTATAADLQALVKAEKANPEEEKPPVLSGLAVAPGLGGGLLPAQRQAWFPLLHLLPASCLLGLWLWDRRRRFLEKNPGVVLRRRALRALRRERRSLERAVRARDSAKFAAVAVNAMKVAVAPHYPAEPRALVGADVITVLPEPFGSAAKTVRRLFSTADAAFFAAKQVDTRELLELRPEIEGVLDELEARLCD